MAKPWGVSAVLVLFGVAGQSCSSCVNANAVISESQNVGPVNDHQVRCECLLHSQVPILPDGGSDLPNLNFDVCAPADLNTALGAQVTEEEYSVGINRFCRRRVADYLRAMTGFIEPAACGVLLVDCRPGKINSAEDGGILAAVAPNINCDKPCTSTQCVVGLPSGEIKPADAGPVNCFSLSAVDFNTGEINPPSCSCTVMKGCGLVADGGICQPMSTVIDPPTIDTGVPTYLLGQPTTIELDPVASHLTINVVVRLCDPTGAVCVNATTTGSSGLRGSVTLFGRPCPGGQCRARVALTVFPENLVLSPVCVGALCIPTSALSDMSVAGGTTEFSVDVDENGHALIPAGVLSTIIGGVRDGRRFRIEAANPNDVLFIIDHPNRVFRTPGVITQSFADGSSANLELRGAVTNSPPRVAAPSLLERECTGPAGARVELDAAATADRDDDLINVSWWHGAPFASLIAASPRAELTAPLGDTLVSVSATDSHLVTDVAGMTVRVVDSTPPALDVEAAPDCLWPPNHRLVYYELGANVRAAVVDTCDPSPRVEVVDVVSDEPADAPGSGSTARDYSWNATGFCLRAERSGTADGRTYRVSIRSTDASGNASTTIVPIRVPHDQGHSQGCREGRGVTVEDDDARCGAPLAPVAPPAPVSLPPEPTATPQQPPAGCSSVGVPLMLLALLLILTKRSTRRSALSMFAAMTAVLALQSCQPAVAPNTVPYETCIRGWWIDPMPTSGCACPGPAECAQGDCGAYSFLGVTADGGWHSGSVSVSAQARSLSTQARVSTSSYRIAEPKMIELTTGSNVRKVAVDCAATGLTLNGVPKVKMEATMADRVAQQLDQGRATWAALPY